MSQVVRGGGLHAGSSSASASATHPRPRRVLEYPLDNCGISSFTCVAWRGAELSAASITRIYNRQTIESET